MGGRQLTNSRRNSARKKSLRKRTPAGFRTRRESKSRHSKAPAGFRSRGWSKSRHSKAPSRPKAINLCRRSNKNIGPKCQIHYVVAVNDRQLQILKASSDWRGEQVVYEQQRGSKAVAFEYPAFGETWMEWIARLGGDYLNRFQLARTAVSEALINKIDVTELQAKIKQSEESARMASKASKEQQTKLMAKAKKDQDDLKILTDKTRLALEEKHRNNNKEIVAGLDQMMAEHKDSTEFYKQQNKICRQNLEETSNHLANTIVELDEERVKVSRLKIELQAKPL